MFEAIKNFFRKGGAKLGMVQSLNNITDHPKISVDPKEYDRIQRDLRYFEGKFPKVKYLNSNGEYKERPFTSLNMLQVSARRLASIVFNEQAKINVPNYAKEFVDEVLFNNDFEKNFEKYLESMFALGGLAIEPYYDSGSKKIKLSWAQAPSIYPLKSNTNNISDIAIASKIQKTEGQKTVYYTHLEFHEWQSEKKYTITHELYRSEVPNIVGMQVPITTIYSGMPDTDSLENYSKPLVTYIKPAGFNNMNITSPLGLGIASNSINTLKQINDAYDQFNLEIKFGQRRIAVTQDMMRFGQDERDEHRLKPIFDSNEIVYQQVPGNPDDPKITDLTSDIRTEQYVAAINNLIRTYEMQIGLSSGTFSFDSSQGLKTATEVVSENSMTYQTRNSQISQIERGIQELIVSICELGKAYKVYKGDIPTINDISVDFDDGIFTDKQAQLNYWNQKVIAGFATKADAIMAIDGISEQEAKQKADEIDGNTIDETAPNDDESDQVKEGGGLE